MDKVRVTKSQRFEDICNLLNGQPVKYGTTIADAVDVLNHERDLLAKKNASVDKRKLAESAKNEQYKTAIVEFLDGKADGVTCADIIRNVPSCNGFSTSKVASLFKALKTEGVVDRREVKGQARFFLV